MSYWLERVDKQVTFIGDLSNKEQKFNAPKDITVKHFLSNIEIGNYAKGENIVLKPWEYFILIE